MTVAYGHTTLNMSAASGLASWMGDCLGIPGAVSFFTTTCMSFVETSDHPVTHQEVDQLRLLLLLGFSEFDIHKIFRHIQHVDICQ